MKIFEFHPGIGAFSSGFEYFPENQVVQIQKINKNELYSYNLCHKKRFSVEKSEFIDVSKLKKHDLALLKPDFGVSMSQKRFRELKFDELWSCLAYIEAYQPKIAIIITPTAVIPHLNLHQEYVKDEFDMISKDIVLASMQASGYMAWQLTVDQVQCGVPMFSPVNFYVAVRNDLGTPEDTCRPTIRHSTSSGKLPYITTLDALSDLPVNRYEPHNSYCVDPINTYQAWCRRDCGSTVMNNLPHQESEEIVAILNNIQEGSSLKKASEGKIAKGSRAILARPATLSHDFYKIRGGGAAVHPVCPRAFTIREGMRLHGLPDHIHLLDSLSMSKQASIVHQEISPLTAAYVYEFILPYTNGL